MVELKPTPSQGREFEMRLPVGDIATLALAPGQFLTITTNGEPVIGSLFAFASEDRSEWLSVGNTRILLGTLRLCPGHRLFSNRRRALFVWVEDSGRGHDLLLPPCAQPATAKARSSAPVLERLDEAFARIGADRAHVSDPLNLFLDTRINAGGRIEMPLPSVRSCEHVVLRATTGLCCVVLAWSLVEVRPEAGATLRLAVRNDRPTSAPTSRS